jgi:hypothetical protein
MLFTYASYHLYRSFCTSPAAAPGTVAAEPPPPPPPTASSLTLPLLLVLAAVVLLLRGETSHNDSSLVSTQHHPPACQPAPAAGSSGSPSWTYLSTQAQADTSDSPVEASVPSWVFWTAATAAARAAREAKLPLPSIGQLRSLQERERDTPVFLSQDGEDQYAMEHFFAGKHSGVVLESGALDGRMFSTTWSLTEYWGWRAVHVEGFRPNFVQLVANRPDQLNIHAALCNSTLPLHWVKNDDQLTSVNGFWEMLSLEVKEKWFTAFTPERVAALPATTCRPLSPLLGVYGITHIDLWVLDIEGSEHMALASVDWSKVLIDVISVEVLEPRTQGELDNELLVRQLIIEQGYFEHSQQGRNTWYTRPGWEPSSCSKFPERCRDAEGWVSKTFRQRLLER